MVPGGHDGTGNALAVRVDHRDRTATAAVGRETAGLIIRMPLDAVGAREKVDIKAKCTGGGKAGQAGALSLGIAEMFGWRWAFAFLAPGPALGVVAMLRLRRVESDEFRAGARS